MCLSCESEQRIERRQSESEKFKKAHMTRDSVEDFMLCQDRDYLRHDEFQGRKESFDIHFGEDDTEAVGFLVRAVRVS